MKKYFVKIIITVIFSTVIDTLMPEDWKKYTKIITGLMIAAVVISPVKKIEIPDFDSISYDFSSVQQQGEELRTQLVKEELCKTIGEDIQALIKEQEGTSVSVKVYISVSEKGEITGVNKVVLSDKISDESVNKIYEIYSPGEVVIDGF